MHGAFCWVRGLAADVNVSGLWSQRGIVYSDDLGQFKQALADFTQAVRLTAGDGDPLAWRGMTHGQLAQSMRSQGVESFPEWQRSWQDCEAAVRLGVHSAGESSVLTCVGRALLLMNDLQGAVKPLNRAIEIDRKNADAYQNRGSALEQMGQFSNALSDYEMVLQLDPNDVWAHCRRGLTLEALGRGAEARKDKGFCAENEK